MVANAERVVRQLSFFLPKYMVGKGGYIMAADVVPVLNERIETSFKSNVMKDRRIAQISKRIRDGTATFVDGHDYAERLGENLSRALTENLTADTLPDGKLYYNIAKRTVTPALETNYNLTNEAAADIQKILDAQAEIGLNAVKADFPADRIQGLIDKMTADGITLEQALIWLEEPIINISEAFFDEFIDSNAKFRNDVGLKTTITRKVAGNCCDWCAAMAGTYDYGEEPPDIYRRHQFCRCSVTYKCGKTVQNVWSKRTWESSSEDKANRMIAGLRKNKMSAQEKIEVANAVYRDKVISTMESKDRRKNLRKYSRMSAEERLARLKEFEEKRAMRG